MNTTIGTTQTSISHTDTPGSGAIVHYITTFISDKLNQTSIAANTWTYNFAALEDNALCNFPTSSTGNVNVTCYVWRTSTGTKVGTIKDGATTSNNFAEPAAASSERVVHGQFVGAAVSSLNVNDDVIVFEVLFSITRTSTGTFTKNFYFDGTTANTISGSVVSNHASFIETPETISFAAALTRISLTRIYKNKIAARVSLSRIYKNKIAARVALSRIYKNKIVGRVSLSRIYKNRIRARVSLSRIYKNKILIRISLSRIYRNKILTRVSLSRIYKNRILTRISLSRIYKNRILNRISLARIYKNRLLTRVSRSRIYLNKIGVRVSLSKTYKNRILNRISLSRIYKNKIVGRVSLTRIYKNKIVARISLSRVYKNKIQARISLSRIYKNKIVARISLSRIYKNKIRSRVSLSRIYKNRILNRVSLSRIYKNKIVGRVSLSRIYRNKVFVRVSLSRVYKNRILNRISLTRIYKNRILKRISLSRIYKNRILTRISLTRVYKNRILLRVSLSRIYKNKIQARVSLTRKYVNQIIVAGLTRISLQRTYKNKIQARVSAPRVYKNRLLQRVSAYSIFLDNIDDSITIPNIAAINNLDDYTIAFWLYPTINVAPSTPNIVNKLYPSNNGFIIYFTGSSLNLNFRTVGNTGVGVSVSNTTYMPGLGYNRWYHIAVTVTRSTGAMKLYIDGVLRNSGTNLDIGANLSGTVANLVINGGASPNKFAGMIKDFRLYRTAQDTAINDIYNNSPNAPIPNYWQKMEEGTGLPVDEISGTNTMTLTNGPAWKSIAPDVWTGRLQTYKNRLLQRVGVGSIFFDGVNDYLNCGNDATLWSGTLSKFSFSLWIYNDTSIAASALIIDHNSNLAQSFVVYNSTIGTAITFRINNAAAANVNCTASGLPSLINRWVHIVGTYDNSLGTLNMKLYIDGIRTGNQPNLNETLTTSANLILGGPVNDHRGPIKDFRWWNNKALTPAEISDIYNNLSTAPTPDYWLKMNEGTGNPVDSISGTKTAVLTNGAFWKPVAPDILTGMLEVYKNKIAQRISLSRTYVNRLLQRVGAYAISFDGINDYIDCGNDATLWTQSKSKFSFAFWMRLDAYSDGIDRDVVTHAWAANGSFLLHLHSSNKNIIYTFRDSVGTILSAVYTLPVGGTGLWYHVACTYDNTLGSGNAKIYIDKVKGIDANSTSVMAANGTLLIGGTTSDFLGLIKDFRWYTTKALTQQEITDIYSNSTNAPAPDYWLKMDEGTGSSVDEITETKTAILTNGAKWTFAAPNVWIGKSQTYKNRIFLRISLSRIYKNKIFGRVSLSRIYKNRILNRLSLTRIYKNRILARVSSPRIYKNRILNRISLSRIYKNRILARISLLRTYKNRIRSRVSLTRIYRNRILLRASLTRIYKNRIKVRVSLSRIYKNKILSRTSLSRIYKNRILNRIAFTRTYQNRILVRISRSRIYKNRILNRMSLTRVYKNRILSRRSLSRVYKNRILNRLSLTRIYKNRITIRVSLSRIYKNKITGRVSLSRIYKNQILARISLSRIYKNMILIRVSLPRVYKNSILERVSLSRTYINQIIVVLSRVSLHRTYVNKIQSRVSLTRIYINVIEKAKKEVRKGFGVREKIPRTTSFLRGWYDRTTNR